jgi:tellurite resistance protein
MSGPDGIDERLGTLVGELRSGEQTASPELRERVRAIAARGPEPPATTRRHRFPRRRLTLVLVPVCALVAVAVGAGLFTSGGPSRTQSAGGDAYSILGHDRAVPGKVGLGQFKPPLPMTGSQHGAALKAADAPAPSGSRHQLYSADLRLRVSDLSATTKQAIRLTRGWGGYLVSVEYGSAQKAGEAYLVVRVPITKVQTAVARLTALGTIVADHVSIQDVQNQLNQRYSRMQALRVKITKLRGKLTDPSLTQSRREFFQAEIAQNQAALAALQEQQLAQVTRTSFATVSLDLQTKKAAAAPPPSKPGLIGKALSDIGHVLLVEAEVLLYVLLIGAPFLILGLLLWFSRRTWRRRSEEQLLAR